MGVLRWGSSRVSVMIVRFPVMLSTYVRSRKKKITTWISGSSVRPRRMKYVTDVPFLIPHGLSTTNLIKSAKISGKHELESQDKHNALPPSLPLSPPSSLPLSFFFSSLTHTLSVFIWIISLKIHFICWKSVYSVFNLPLFITFPIL